MTPEELEHAWANWKARKLAGGKCEVFPHAVLLLGARRIAMKQDIERKQND